MGLSVAASSAIIFVGFLFVATVMFTAINTTIMGIEENLTDATERQGDYAKTSFRVDNATKNTTAIFINVTNIGSNVLKVSGMDVLVNGTLTTGKLTKHSVSGSTTTDLWAPSETLYLELGYVASSGVRVSIVAHNGATATGVLT